MKCIVIGLGNFGIALSQRLTTMGFEVLGVDSNINRVNMYKDTVKNIICLDMSDEQSATTLPLKDADIVFVTLGKDISPSILATAILKQNHVKRIIARAISPLHRTILEAMGIKEIITPEKEYADFFAQKIDLSTSIHTYMITDQYMINEMKLPDSFVGRVLGDVKFEKDFSLKLIAIKHVPGKQEKTNGNIELIDKPSDEFVIGKEDIFILAGKTSCFRKLNI